MDKDEGRVGDELVDDCDEPDVEGEQGRKELTRGEGSDKVVDWSEEVMDRKTIKSWLN